MLAVSSGTPRLDAHFGGEADQGTFHGHARRVSRRFAEQFGQLVIGQTHFDAADDRLAIGRAQPLQRRLISIQRLTADGLLKRRRR